MPPDTPIGPACSKSCPKKQEQVNSSRPDGSAWYTPLHQAAWHGASVGVVLHLIRLGAWRTLRNARGERALDVAQRRGHQHLLRALAPQYRHHVPQGVLLRIQAHLHAVIHGRCEDLVERHSLRLPELGPLLELDRPQMWFSVAGHGWWVLLRTGFQKAIRPNWFPRAGPASWGGRDSGMRSRPAEASSSIVGLYSSRSARCSPSPREIERVYPHTSDPDESTFSPSMRTADWWSSVSSATGLATDGMARLLDVQG